MAAARGDDFEAETAQVFSLEVQRDRLAEVRDQLVEGAALSDDRELQTLRDVPALLPGHHGVHRVTRGRGASHLIDEGGARGPLRSSFRQRAGAPVAERLPYPP